MDHQKGFSLLELVFVLIILSILMVYPLFNLNNTLLDLNAEANLLSYYLHYTQSLAIAKSEKYTFIANSNNSYQIQNAQNKPITLTNGNVSYTLTGVTFSSVTNLPNRTVTFDGTGTPFLDTNLNTGLSSNQVYGYTLSDNQGNSKTVNITPMTGKVY